MTTPSTTLLASLQHLNAEQLRRLLVEQLTQQKLGLYWESNAIARDAALNADVVLPRLCPDTSHTPPGTAHHSNLIIEGVDSLRLLRATHAEHDNYFYPDFVVRVRHSPGEQPMQRLLESKEDTKHAARKAQHSPASYSKVLFRTPDGDRVRWVNDNGSLGEALDFEDLQAALGHLAATRPEGV